MEDQAHVEEELTLHQFIEVTLEGYERTQNELKEIELLVGGEKLGHGRHSDEIAAHSGHHLNLRRGLVARAAEPGVNALVEVDPDLVAQPGRQRP